jgi:simple sugar transport system permease protein
LRFCCSGSCSRRRSTTRCPATARSSTAAFVSEGALGQTLIAATPLAFTGLAAAAAFRMRLFNIGGEGQLYVGTITAAAGLYSAGVATRRRS